MGKEEYILKLGMLEQEFGRLQQQMQIIEQQILELQGLQIGLQELEKTEEKQMLANLGKGVFIKTEILDKELLVDIGNRIFVKKDISKTTELIEEQLEKLIEARTQIIEKMQGFQEQMEKIIVEAEKAKE